jgi:hypothetical protein
MGCRQDIIDPCEDTVGTYEDGEGVYQVPVRAATDADGDVDYVVSTNAGSESDKVQHLFIYSVDVLQLKQAHSGCTFVVQRAASTRRAIRARFNPAAFVSLLKTSIT